MLVWQVSHWYFHSVDLHPNADALGKQVDITARAEIRMLGEFVRGSEGIRYSIFFVHTHMSAILTLMCFRSK